MQGMNRIHPVVEIIRPAEPCDSKSDALLHALRSLMFPNNISLPATAVILFPIDTRSGCLKFAFNKRKPCPSGALQVKRLMDRNMSSDNLIAGLPV